MSPFHLAHSVPFDVALQLQMQTALVAILFKSCLLVSRPYGALRRWVLLNVRLPFYLKLNDLGAVNRLLLHSRFAETRAILLKMATNLGQDSYVENHLFIHNARCDYSNLTIGQKAYVGKDCFFDLSDKITIGDGAVLAMRVTILTHFDGGSSEAAQRFPRMTRPVDIHSGAYVGAGALLLPGVTIGDGALVAAGSVVLKDVPPRSEFAGVPAREISRAKSAGRDS